jgi:hypothetical protein
MIERSHEEEDCLPSVAIHGSSRKDPRVPVLSVVAVVFVLVTDSGYQQAKLSVLNVARQLDLEDMLSYSSSICRMIHSIDCACCLIILAVGEHNGCSSKESAPFGVRPFDEPKEDVEEHDDKVDLQELSVAASCAFKKAPSFRISKVGLIGYNLSLSDDDKKGFVVVMCIIPLRTVTLVEGTTRWSQQICELRPFR